jgi:hypothetical protein
MAANTTPIFTLKGNFTPARINATNTASDGSGTIGSTIFTIVTAGVDGTRVDGIRFTNSGSATSGSPNAKVMRIFLSDTTGALATNRLIGEIAGLTTPAKSNVAATATALYTFDQPIIMRSGQVMYVTMSQAAAYSSTVDQMDAIAYAGDY